MKTRALTLATLTLFSSLITSAQAHDNDNAGAAIVAGVIGGIIAGGIVASTVRSDRYYNSDYNNNYRGYYSAPNGCNAMYGCGYSRPSYYQPRYRGW